MHAQEKYPHLSIYQESPLNAAPPPERLRQTFLTPTDQFFIRTHGSIPKVDQENFRLKVNGLVQNQLELSFAELLTRFAQHTITATLVCAGSRRNELADIHPLPAEILWHADPISTANRRGVRLHDDLQMAGIGEQTRYVAVLGLDECRKQISRSILVGRFG